MSTETNGKAATPAERWAIVDLFGRLRYAGRISQVRQFGEDMCRIEVPSVDGRPGFGKDVGGKAIFEITDVTEEIVLAWLRHQRLEAVPSYQLALPPGAVPPDAEEVGPTAGARSFPGASPACPTCGNFECTCPDDDDGEEDYGDDEDDHARVNHDDGEPA